MFNFTTDATGYIGIHEEPDYTNMTASDTVINGMVLFAERIDGVVVGTITPAVGGLTELLSEPDPETPVFSDMTKAQLLDYAWENGVDGVSS